MDNIIVTELNIYATPKFWLITRYGLLRTLVKIDNNNYDEVKEMEIIENYLSKHGGSNIIETYNAMGDQVGKDLPNILRKQYEPIVEERLIEYFMRRKRRAKLYAEISQEQSRPWTINMPSVTASYEAVGGGSGGLPSSSTEKAVMRAMDRIDRLEDEVNNLDILLGPMESVFGELKDEQARMLEYLYDSNEKETDDYVINKLNCTRKKFYLLKKETLFKVAELMRLI